MSKTLSESTIKSVTSGNLQNIQSQATNATKSLQSQANQIVSSVQSTVSSVMGKLQSAGFSAGDMLGLPSDIGKTIFGNTNGLFAEKNKVDNTKLGNFTDRTSEMMKQNLVNLPNALNAFSNNSNNLSSKGLGFIASTTNKAIDGIDLPGADVFTNFSDMGIGQLGKLANLGSEVFNSGVNALKAVTSSLTQSLNVGKNVISSVVSGVTNTASSILKPLEPIVSTAATVLNPSSVANIVSNNLNFLPYPLQKMISNKAADLSQNLVDELSNMLGVPQVFGNNFSNIANAVLDLTNSNDKYNTSGRRDDLGNYVQGYTTYRGDDNTYQQIIQLIKSICDKAYIANTRNYDADKMLYDMLAYLLGALGLGGLLKALMECKDQFNDSRTFRILGEVLKSSAINGDSYSTLVSYQTGGAPYSSDMKTILQSLIANSDYSTPNRENINTLLGQTNYTIRDLIEDEDIVVTNKSNKVDVYDATMSTFMQASCTDYVDEGLSKIDRNLINEVFYNFA